MLLLLPGLLHLGNFLKPLGREHLYGNSVRADKGLGADLGEGLPDGLQVIGKLLINGGHVFNTIRDVLFAGGNDFSQVSHMFGSHYPPVSVRYFRLNPGLIRFVLLTQDTFPSDLDLCGARGAVLRLSFLKLDAFLNRPLNQAIVIIEDLLACGVEGIQGIIRFSSVPSPTRPLVVMSFSSSCSGDSPIGESVGVVSSIRMGVSLYLWAGLWQKSSGAAPGPLIN
jgi:hypothetical protein